MCEKNEIDSDLITTLKCPSCGRQNCKDEQFKTECIYCDGNFTNEKEDKITVWILLEGRMMASDSTAQVFRSEETALEEYNKRHAELIKEATDENKEQEEEFKKNEDLYTVNDIKGVIANAWFSVDALKLTGDDVYIELSERDI